MSVTEFPKPRVRQRANDRAEFAQEMRAIAAGFEDGNVRSVLVIYEDANGEWSSCRECPGRFTLVGAMEMVKADILTDDDGADGEQGETA